MLKIKDYPTSIAECFRLFITDKEEYLNVLDQGKIPFAGLSEDGNEIVIPFDEETSYTSQVTVQSPMFKPLADTIRNYCIEYDEDGVQNFNYAKCHAILAKYVKMNEENND